MFLSYFLKKLIGCEEQELNSKIESLILDLNQTTKNNLQLVKIISELKDRLNYNAEKFLHSKFDTKPLLYKKRWIFNKNNVYPADIRNYIHKDATLPNLKTIEDIWKFKLTYVSDNFTKHGILDFWQTSTETHTLGNIGDCEDLSIFRINCARNLDNKNVFLGVGFFGKTGHAFPVLFKDRKLFVLEATSNKYEPKEIDVETMKNSEYKIHYLVNENFCWVVRDNVSFRKMV